MARGKNSLVGQRRQKIKLFRPIETESHHRGGAKRHNFIQYAEPWAKIFDSRSIEIFENDQKMTILSVKVQIRHSKTRVIEGQDLARFKGKTWRLIRPAENQLHLGDYTDLYFSEYQGDFTILDQPSGIIFNENGTDGFYLEDFSDYFYTATGVN